MPTINEAVQEHRDEVDGFRVDVAKVELYLTQLILWILILITTVLVFSLVTIVWNFFAAPGKALSDRMIDKGLNAINSENIAGLVAEGHSGRFSSTSTIPPNGSTAEC